MLGLLLFWYSAAVALGRWEINFPESNHYIDRGPQPLLGFNDNDDDPRRRPRPGT